jgi:O-methyltransferase
MNIDQVKLLYLDLLKNTLTDFHRMENSEYIPITWGKLSRGQKLLFPIDKLISGWNYRICQSIQQDKNKRLVGADWPFQADTMIGIKRLENIQSLAFRIFENNIPGDFIETGVWRGGATIFMRAIIRLFDSSDRKVWVADSFEGLPPPNHKKYIYDKGDKHYTEKILSIPLEVVKKNFEKYDLLDENVIFLKGWFKDTLPNAPIDQISLLRLDGDMYESTMDALVNLYHKVSVGGFIIIDDWNTVPACQQAVKDFRSANSIYDEIIEIDWAGVYWEKT